MQKVFALFGRETLVRHHGYVYGVRRFLNDLKADDAFGVLGAVADIAQVDLAVFGRPDEIGGTSINMLDHRKARAAGAAVIVRRQRSEEHTSELQSLMRTSYAVFCLDKKD